MYIARKIHLFEGDEAGFEVTDIEPRVLADLRRKVDPDLGKSLPGIQVRLDSDKPMTDRSAVAEKLFSMLNPDLVADLMSDYPEVVGELAKICVGEPSDWKAIGALVHDDDVAIRLLCPDGRICHLYFITGGFWTQTQKEIYRFRMERSLSREGVNSRVEIFSNPPDQKIVSLANADRALLEALPIQAELLLESPNHSECWQVEYIHGYVTIGHLTEYHY